MTPYADGVQVTAVPAGKRRDGTPITRSRTFTLARSTIEPFGPNRARIFYAVWVPALNRFDAHPMVVVANSIRPVNEARP